MLGGNAGRVIASRDMDGIIEPSSETGIIDAIDALIHAISETG
jgi:hypothetical protein